MAGRRKKKKSNVNSGAIVGITIALIVVTGLIAILAHSLFGKGRTLPEPAESVAEEESAAEAEESASSQEEAETPAESEEEIPEEERTYLTESQLHSGDLILVSSEYAFSFKDATDDLVEIAAHGENPVSVTENGMMMADCDAEVQNYKTGIASAYRTKEIQQSIWDQYEQLYGTGYCEEFVAVPGYSEHHTGLAADLTVITGWGEDTFSGSPNAGWMDTHCGEYGFVRRYKEEKADITGISNEAWHFRYVGKAHAAYMNEYNLCLEEYIDLLRDHPEEEALLVHADKDYKIWYTEESYIRTPENPFTVSGNNIDGFIITEIEG